MVEEYLNKEYNRTKWHYFSLMKLLNMFGEEVREELNKLREEGKVKSRNGSNGILVQLLVTKDGEIIKEY